MEDDVVYIINIEHFIILCIIDYMMRGDSFEPSHSNIGSLQVDPLVLYATMTWYIYYS